MSWRMLTGLIAGGLQEVAGRGAVAMDSQLPSGLVATIVRFRVRDARARA
jgi:hypothetical protein